MLMAMLRPKRVWTLCLLAAVSAAAADFGALRPQGYVNDFARVLDPAAVSELNAYCAAVERAAGVEIALVVVPSLQGEPVEDVANLLFRNWGVGKKQTNEGVLLLISAGDRRTRLEVGYGLEPVIPDGYAGVILREMRPALRAQDYRAALFTAARAIAQRVAQSKGIDLGKAVPGHRAPPPQEPFPWLLAASMGGFFLLLLARAWHRELRRIRRGGEPAGGVPAALVLGQLLGGSGLPPRSSGGFGGYDSSDSFGGFGGGDSGGGGASSDW